MRKFLIAALIVLAIAPCAMGHGVQFSPRRQFVPVRREFVVRDRFVPVRREFVPVRREFVPVVRQPVFVPVRRPFFNINFGF